MLWLFYILYMLIICLGIVASYTDIKYGKVRNKHLLAFLSIVLFIYSLFLIMQIIDMKYFGLVFLYTLFAFLLGFFLWLFKFWSAGDAKLYSLFVFLIPLDIYNVSEFLPLSILINAFIPLFLFYLTKALIITSWTEKYHMLKKIATPKNLLSYLLVVFAIGWIVRWALFYFNITSNFFYSIIGIFILSRLFVYLFKEYTLIILAIISMLRIVFNYDFIISSDFLISYLITTIVYALIIMFVYELSNVFVKKIKSEKNYILVEETTPFAIFLFIGVLMTIILRGNIILFLRHSLLLVS